MNDTPPDGWRTSEMPRPSSGPPSWTTQTSLGATALNAPSSTIAREDEDDPGAGRDGADLLRFELAERTCGSCEHGGTSGSLGDEQLLVPSRCCAPAGGRYAAGGAA